MRRLVLLSLPAVLAALCVLPAQADSKAVGKPHRPDPCTITFAGEPGDGALLYPAPIPVNDGDIDITDVTLRLTATDIIATLTVPGLADHALGGTGDAFNLIAYQGPTLGIFGYRRDLALGGAPDVSIGLPAPMPMQGPPVVPLFNRTTGTVVLTASRAAFAASLHVTSAGLHLTQLQANSEVYAGNRWRGAGDTVAAADFEALDAPACDRWLARQKAPATPCTAVVNDAVADETSPVGEDDDLDITSVTLTSTPTSYVRTVRLARLQSRPIGGDGHRFDSTLEVAGKAVALPSGTTTYDESTSTVTTTVTKDAAAKALGLSSVKGLKASLKTTTATATAGGRDTYVADTAGAVTVTSNRCG